MKKIYEFRIPCTKKEPKEERGKDPETGEEITITKQKEVKTYRTFFLRRPNRAMYDEADLFYAVSVSDFIKKGVMTRQQLAKRFDDDDGIFSKKAAISYKKILEEWLQAEKDLEKLEEVVFEDRSEEQHEQAKVLKSVIDALKSQVQEYELAQNHLFEQTAENKARNKTILWWLLFASYEDGKDGDREIFKKPKLDDGEEDNYECRLSVYDELEENGDEFWNQVVQRFIHLLGAWYVGNVEDEEEFKKLDDDFVKVMEEQKAAKQKQKEDAKLNEAKQGNG